MSPQSVDLPAGDSARPASQRSGLLPGCPKTSRVIPEGAGPVIPEGAGPVNPWARRVLAPDYRSPSRHAIPGALVRPTVVIRHGCHTVARRHRASSRLVTCRICLYGIKGAASGGARAGFAVPLGSLPLPPARRGRRSDSRPLPPGLHLDPARSASRVSRRSSHLAPRLRGPVDTVAAGRCCAARRGTSCKILSTQTQPSTRSKKSRCAAAATSNNSLGQYSKPKWPPPNFQYLLLASRTFVRLPGNYMICGRHLIGRGQHPERRNSQVRTA